MGYSGIFSPDTGSYPLVCAHETVTGEQCPSCGLSHAFSLIVRGRPQEAMEYNPYSMRVFLFFALQLLLRVVLTVIWLKETKTSVRNNLVLSDGIISTAMFVTAFYPLLRFTITSALSLI